MSPMNLGVMIMTSMCQEVYYQQARPSMTGQAAVGRSVKPFIPLLILHISELFLNILLLVLLYPCSSFIYPSPHS